jgi:hypothetical protein
MDTQTSFDPHSAAAAVARAIAVKGSQRKLVAACGVSQALIAQAKIGAVPGSALRPDLWRSPEHVPVEHDPSFQIDTADPDIRAVTGFGRDRAGDEIRHAVALACGEMSTEDLDAAIVTERRAGS